jgi:hypothetical protein
MLVRTSSDDQWVDCAVCGEGYFTRREAVEAAEALMGKGVRLVDLELHDAVVHFLAAYDDTSGLDDRSLDELVATLRKALATER